MLNKIVAIKNVGKFLSCCAAGDVQFRTVTLIFAENGCGKTTLCDILRSLQSGTPDIISGRATLGSTDKPRVELLLDNSIAIFKDGIWSSSYPDIAVYDSKFINDNVYTGDHVAHAHRKNLYRVIVGEQGVTLAKQVEEIDAKIRGINKAISDMQPTLRAFAEPFQLKAEAFASLPKIDDLDSKITAAQKIVDSAKKATEIAAKPVLTHLTLPALSPKLEELLSQSLDDVSHDAESVISSHMATCMQEPDETWLSRGLSLLVDEACPFCGQSLHAQALLAAYKTHFADSYKQLIVDIDIMKTMINSFADEADLLRLEQALVQNDNLSDYWSQFLCIGRPSVALAALREPLLRLKASALRCIYEKASHPLDKIKPGTDLTIARQFLVETFSLVEKYNMAVDQANKLIASKKNEAKTSQLAAAEVQLRRLQATKTRHSSAPDKVCNALTNAQACKKKLEAEKLEAKKRLDQYSSAIFQQYQGNINRLLQMFGADFRIENTGGRYTGGTPSSTYHLVINDSPVELGDAETPLTQPSFRNTVSSGDKTTLALAFFLSQLHQDPNHTRKIVVFDDPFTSQDRSRRSCTQQEICKLSKTTKQILVLSHDPRFLKLLYDALPNAILKTLQLTRMGITTTYGVKIRLDRVIHLPRHSVEPGSWRRPQCAFVVLGSARYSDRPEGGKRRRVPF